MAEKGKLTSAEEALERLTGKLEEAGEEVKSSAEEAMDALQAKLKKTQSTAQQAATEAAEKVTASPYVAEHTVASGDNLSYISREYYGTTDHWQKIYEANKETIGDNPNLIRVGQVLKIPRL